MKLRTAIVTATTAALLASSGVAIAGASGSATPPVAAKSATAAPAAPRAAALLHGKARDGRRLRARVLIRRGAIEVVTKTIGIDRKTLRAGIVSGQTIGQIATAHGSSPQAVIDALVNAAKARLAAAVSAGKIRSERAARIEAKLSTRVTKIVNEWHPKRLRNLPAS